MRDSKSKRRDRSFTYVKSIEPVAGRATASMGYSNQDMKNYEVEVVRIGTGYRVYYSPEEHSRGFDVGYADRKQVFRPHSIEVKVDAKNTSLVVKGMNKIDLMNLVAKIEKVRPVSVYTGNGILRKDLIGKIKRKSTKSTL